MSKNYRFMFIHGWKITEEEMKLINEKTNYEYEEYFYLSAPDSVIIFGDIAFVSARNGLLKEILDKENLIKNLSTMRDKEKYLNILKRSDLKITEPKLYFIIVDYS